jgi:hypothetical protein
VYQNDVWALSFAGSPQWTLLTPIGVPPPGRTEHTAIYDPIRDRMVVFGGMNPTRYNDVWELTLGDNPAWSMISAAGTPPSARWAHCSIYDPVSDRMIAFAGYDGAYRNDLWGLSLGGTPTWSPIGASGTPPINGNQRTAVYDPFRDRMIVFGGGILGGSQFTSALGLAEDPAWTLLTTAPLQIARYSHAAIFDPDGDRMLVYGGQNGPTDETWALTFTGVVAAPPLPVPAAQARVERVTPNPSRGSVVFELGLAPGEPRAVEIFDLRGNRVWRTDPAAAASRIAWDGRRGDGSRVPAGIYFARLAGAPAPAARFVILR